MSKSKPNSPDRQNEDKYSLLASDSDILSDRRSSSESQNVSLSISKERVCEKEFKPRDEQVQMQMARKSMSYSMSDDSSDEGDKGSYGTEGVHKHRRRRSRKCKIQRQKTSLSNDDKECDIFTNEQLKPQQQLYQQQQMLMQQQQVLIKQPSVQSQNRRMSSSSDVSDIYYDEQSCTSGDSPYWRSPRESADSDMLGLPCYGSYGQRRSIPSLQIDTVDSNHLTLKDCFQRRSSTGRALPKVRL